MILVEESKIALIQETYHGKTIEAFGSKQLFVLKIADQLQLKYFLPLIADNPTIDETEDIIEINTTTITEVPETSTQSQKRKNDEVCDDRIKHMRLKLN